MVTRIVFAVCAAALAVLAQPAPEVLPPPGPDVAIFQAQVPPPHGGDFMYMRTEMAGPGTVVKGAPYSAEITTEVTQVLADGNRIHRKDNGAMYRDSEGRTRREQALGPLGPLSAGPKPTQLIFINDPVAALSYVLNPDDKTAQKMPVPGTMSHVADAPGGGMGMMSHAAGATGGMGGGMRMQRRRAPAVGDQQFKRESLGSKMIEGVAAEGTRTVVTIPAGAVGNERPIESVSERWYSQQLQAVVLSTQTDPRFGETVYRLSNINLSEPAHALFEVPADYTVSEGPARRQVFIRKPLVTK